MANTPKDILDYILNNKLESDFLVQMMNHKGGYSISEIADGRFVRFKDEVQFFSDDYDISTKVTDEYIITAVHNRICVSSFISRKGDNYQLHFLAHSYPQSMREKFEEDITKEVVEYLIINTVVALKLNTTSKVDAYIGK